MFAIAIEFTVATLPNVNILRYIAYDVNRFFAQRLVEKAVETGIEPILEEIIVQ
jgi:hypothetical protein